MNIFTCTIHAEHTRNEFYRTLSIRGTNFIACWSYWEPISSHAEHARKCLKVEYLDRIEYDFQKSRVTCPWNHKVSVSAKKSKKYSCLCTFKELYLKNFLFYHRCRWHRWSLINIHSRISPRIFEKNETVLKRYSGDQGKNDSWKKTWSWKSRVWLSSM